MSDWETISLQDAGVILLDCEHKTPKFVSDGIPYIAIPQLKNGRIELEDARCISYSDYPEWTRRVVPQQYDVIVSRRCNPGESSYVPKGLKCALGQNLIILRSIGDTIAPEYLRWMLRGPQWWSQVCKFINVGAVFESLKCADIPFFEFSIPPLSEQRIIAHILGTLDDKIELNRRMNETLEGIARALFKSWFIDFDPVRAKIEGRQPFGMDEETAALFPDQFEDSELGEIPKGWRIGRFIDVIEILSGGTPKTSNPDYWNGDIPWFSVVDSPRESDVYVVDTEKTITQKGIDNSAAQVLPIGTVIISARGTVGKLALTGVPMAMNQSCFGLKSKLAAPFYTYFLTKHLVVYLKQNTHGSVFDTVTRDTFSTVSMTIPRSELVESYEKMVESLLCKIRNNLEESRILGSIRNSLLPKLISGDIRVDPSKFNFESVQEKVGEV